MSSCQFTTDEIYTDDDKEYRIRPIQGKGRGRETLTFDVRCHNDAHVSLLGSDSIAEPMIEVFIGGWKNTKSAIRFNQTKPDKAEEETPGIVTFDEYRRFWITFKHNVIQVGREGEEAPFLQWDNTEEPFKVTHFAFTTGWGSEGYWRFDDGNQVELNCWPNIYSVLISQKRNLLLHHRPRLLRMKTKSKFVNVNI